MFESVLCQLPQVNLDPEIVDASLQLAIEIAREGREGRRIGTIFTIGDHEKVLAHSRLLILDPLLGHPRDERIITNPNLRGTIKELAQLDGAFVVDHDGVFVSACRYLDASGSKVEVPLGLGSRHVAGASITAATDAAAVVVSETATVRVFCHGNLLAEIIPELWMMNKYVSAMKGRTKEERVRDLAIITRPFPV